ncbi:MAG: hypothetical protein R3D03_00105 [Geminicoccaceae bacterium]
MPGSPALLPESAIPSSAALSQAVAPLYAPTRDGRRGVTFPCH